MNRCPSTFEIDNWDLHDKDPVLSQHLATCETCGTRMAVRSRDISEFQETWLAAMRERVENAAALVPPAQARRSRRVWAFGLLVPAAAAFLLVVAFDQESGDSAPPEALSAVVLESYVGSKGAPSFDVVVRRNDETFLFREDTPVAAGDQLRFIARGVPEPYRYIHLGSVQDGVYTPLYPAAPDGESLALPPPGAALPGSIVLDEVRGPERMFVLLSPAPIPVSWAAVLAQKTPEGSLRPVQVQDITAIAGWIVLDKR